MTLARRLALPAILIIAALLALSQVNQHLVLASDNSSYIVLGQALASGRGYVMANEPNAPPMNLYPFGYPLLLAVVLRAAGAVGDPMQAVVPMKLVSVAFYLATLPVIYVLVRRRHGDLPAALVTLLVAVNPAILSLATEILSDMPFVFFTLLGLALIDSMPAVRADVIGGVGNADELRSSISGRARVYRVRPRAFEVADSVYLILGGLALVAAYYMRTAGLATLLAAPLYLLLRRRRRAALGLGIFLALLAVPWFLRSSAPPTPETPFFARSYIHQVLALAPYSDQTVSLLGLVERVINNSLTYATQILPEAMFPHLAATGVLGGVIAGGIAALLLLGFVIEVVRGLRVGEVAVAAYWLSLSLFVWVLGYRYIAVIIPFAFLYFFSAIQWICQLFVVSRRSAREPVAASKAAGAFSFRSRSLQLDGVALALVLVAGLLLLSALAVDGRRAQRNLSTSRGQTLAQFYAGDAEWSRWLEEVSWLKENTPQDAVIIARKPDLLYLVSGRKTAEYPYTQDGSVLMSTIAANKATHILEDAFTWTRSTDTYLKPAMQALPDAFELVHETPAPETRLWQVKPPAP